MSDAELEKLAAKSLRAAADHQDIPAWQAGERALHAVQRLGAFAEMVKGMIRYHVEKEREACARLAEEEVVESEPFVRAAGSTTAARPARLVRRQRAPAEIAAAIRARGKE